MPSPPSKGIGADPGPRRSSAATARGTTHGHIIFLVSDVTVAPLVAASVVGTAVGGVIGTDLSLAEGVFGDGVVNAQSLLTLVEAVYRPCGSCSSAPEVSGTPHAPRQRKGTRRHDFTATRSAAPRARWRVDRAHPPSGAVHHKATTPQRRRGRGPASTRRCLVLSWTVPRASRRRRHRSNGDAVARRRGVAGLLSSLPPRHRPGRTRRGQRGSRSGLRARSWPTGHRSS